MTPEEDRLNEVAQGYLWDAMQKPLPEQPNQAKRKPNRKRLDRPQVWEPDENGEMQIVGQGTNRDGWVDVEDYRSVLGQLEEVEARIREIVNEVL